MEEGRKFGNEELRRAVYENQQAEVDSLKSILESPFQRNRFPDSRRRILKKKEKRKEDKYSSLNRLYLIVINILYNA